ncbi:MAG: hypothetical protein HQL31_04930 [Planctomycetes bacterium]|nr:hypothetical protein [Planctomycetota bacterium]
MQKCHVIFLDDPSPLRDHEGHESSYKGKFIQLHHDELGQILVFATCELCTYHAQIMALFSSRQTPPWAFEINRRGDNGFLHESSSRIIGGGLFFLDPCAKQLELNGTSLAFGTYVAYPFSHQLENNPLLQGYAVRC